MKSTVLIERDANYLCVKLGEIVTALQQVATVKGQPMWEVQRMQGSQMKRYIVPARGLSPLNGS
ncbi:MAG: hypothetical protein L6Q55_07285 [Azonexus sp.]|nr:hypothetical protein [Azonexus sp.]MCK6412212.1 hypothetical protein [Azonexus sp.]